MLRKDDHRVPIALDVSIKTKIGSYGDSRELAACR
jgi:hypothetical protein